MRSSFTCPLLPHLPSHYLFRCSFSPIFSLYNFSLVFPLLGISFSLFTNYSIFPLSFPLVSLHYPFPRISSLSISLVSLHYHISSYLFTIHSPQHLFTICSYFFSSLSLFFLTFSSLPSAMVI